MSGGELAVVLASVAVVVAVAVLGTVGVSISRSLKELRRLLGEIRRDLLPAVQRIEEASGRVTGEVQRVGGLLDVAEAVSERAESLSRVTYRALVEPFAAVAALLRRGGSSQPTAAGEPVATGWGGGAAAAAPRPRRALWGRRLSMYLLRAGYRSASSLIAARLAAAQVQLRVAAARLAAAEVRVGVAAERAGRGRTATDPRGTAGAATASPPGREPAAAGSVESTLGHQLLGPIREVTREISDAMTEGRRSRRADRRRTE